MTEGERLPFMLQSGVSLFVMNCSGQMGLVKSKFIDIKGRKNPVEYFYNDLHLPASRLIFGSMYINRKDLYSA